MIDLKELELFREILNTLFLSPRKEKGVYNFRPLFFSAVVYGIETNEQKQEIEVIKFFIPQSFYSEFRRGPSGLEPNNFINLLEGVYKVVLKFYYSGPVLFEISEVSFSSGSYSLSRFFDIIKNCWIESSKIDKNKLSQVIEFRNKEYKVVFDGNEHKVINIEDNKELAPNSVPAKSVLKKYLTK